MIVLWSALNLYRIIRENKRYNVENKIKRKVNGLY